MMNNNLQSKVIALFYILDGFTIIASCLFSFFYDQGRIFNSHFLISLGILPFFLGVYYFTDLYSFRLGKRFLTDFGKIIQANILALCLILGLLYLVKLEVSRFSIFRFIIFNTLLAVFLRYSTWLGIKHSLAKGRNQKPILLIGAGSLGQEFLKRFLKHPEYGYILIGILDDDPLKEQGEVMSFRVFGTVDSLDEILQKERVNEVVVALPMKAQERIAFVIRTCEKYGIKAMIIPDYYQFIPAKPKVIELEDMPLILIRDVPLDIFINRFLKRFIDLIGSLVLIILFIPIMIIIAIGVKLTSPGSIIFKQVRVGRNRELFNIYKFRSMWVSDNEVATTQWTTENDPRRTSFGEFIRRTSLDELLQLFNVLKGNMSLVGPRPERPYFVDKFKEEIPKYMIKHQVKPGITGWAQVNGWRGDTSIEERIKCDIYYIENWSLLLDLKILMMTVSKGFVNHSAY